MEMNRRQFLAVSAAAATMAVSAGALAGCSSGGSGSASASASASSSAASSSTAAAKYAEEISIAITAQPPTLDSVLTVSSVTLDTICHVIEPLFTMDENYVPQPMLADGYKKSDDGLTYTIALRKGVKFHNGKEMKADDVVASMNRWLTEGSKIKALLEGATFEKVDDYTVDFKVPAPASDIMILLATHSQYPGIVPEEEIKGADPEKGLKNFIGTGPYKFVEWKQDEYIHLTKNDEYQSRTEPPSGYAGAKTPVTKDLYFRIVTDPDTRVKGVKTGEYQVVDGVPAEQFKDLDADPSVTVHARQSGNLTDCLNTQDGPLKDVRIRQAYLKAIDCDKVMMAAYGDPGLYKLGCGFMDESMSQWATDAGKEYWNQADPEGAKKLLEEAGYDGTLIKLMTTPDYQEMYKATVNVCDQLKAAGFNAEVQSYEFATFMDNKTDYTKWDSYIGAIGFSMTPPQLNVMNPKFAGNNDEEVQANIKAIRAASTDQEAHDIWVKTQQRMYEQGIAYVFGQFTDMTATMVELEGYRMFRTSICWDAKLPE